MIQELYKEREVIFQKGLLTMEDLLKLDIIDELIAKERHQLLETIYNQHVR